MQSIDFKPDNRNPADITEYMSAHVQVGSRRGWKTEASVYTQEGSEIEACQCWHTENTAATTPCPKSHAEKPEELQGRWLFGGILTGHFGHLLCESTSRLWALDHVAGDIDGIAYLPPAPAKRAAAENMIQQVLDYLEVSKPYKILLSSTKVEKLIVAEQSMGAGALMLGTPQFRNFIKNARNRPLDDTGIRKLYVSRSRLAAEKGGIFCETHLEEQLEADGYTVFHPQDHTIEEQIRHYRSAETIIGGDGSPFHLLAYAGGSGRTRVALLKRRRIDYATHFTDHLNRFDITVVHELDRIKHIWATGRGRRFQNSAYAELDLMQLSEDLLRLGFIDQPFTAPRIPQTLKKAEQSRLSDSLGRAISPI